MVIGVKHLADAVKVTLGPKANVGAGPQLWFADHHQGWRVGGQGNRTEDKFENMGAQMVKEVAKTNDIAGDGTTTATVLAQAVVAKA